MNLAELGIVVYYSQKANWEEKDYTNFVWKMTQLLDAENIPDVCELNDYIAKVTWERKDGSQ